MKSGASQKSRSRALVVWRKFYIKPNAAINPKFRTICEVLRELYREADARGDILSMHKLDEAHDMAKRMQRKLMSYHKGEIYPSNQTPKGGKTGDEYKAHPQYGDSANLKEADV